MNEAEGTDLTPQTVARWVRELGRSRPVGASRSVEIPREAVCLYESGLHTTHLARRFGVSPTTVRERLRELGVAMRPRGLKYNRLAGREWLETEYWTKGRSAMEIAQGVGCSVLTVHYHLRKHGIPRKRQRRT